MSQPTQKATQLLQALQQQWPLARRDVPTPNSPASLAQAAKKASKPAALRDSDVAEDQASVAHATFGKASDPNSAASGSAGGGDHISAEMLVLDMGCHSIPFDPSTLGAPALGTADYANALAPQVGVDASELTAYLSLISKVGRGLSEAAATDPMVAQICGAALRLHATASAAEVNKENCAQLDGLGHEVLRFLESTSKRQQLPLAPAFTAVVLAQLCLAQRLVQPYMEKGWLMHMICNERAKDTFDAVHATMIASIKEHGLEGGGKILVSGGHKEVCKALRRMVRQQGAGNLTQGLKQLALVAASGEADRYVPDLARLLDVSVRALSAELAALPQLEMDVDTVYAMSYVVQVDEKRDELHRGVFDWYDKDHSGTIDPGELFELIKDLGMIDGKKAAEAELFLTAAFSTADTQRAGALALHEFSCYYATLTTTQARQHIRSTLGIQGEEDLRQLFYTFASFGSRQVQTEMDNVHFSKVFKDSLLLDKELDSTSVDIIFVKAKVQGQRRLTFEQFLTALSLCADKKGVKLEDMARELLAVGGPIANATRADAVRLHDDKSTWTGVYANGGPSTVDPSKDLSVHLDRSQSDIRGVKRTSNNSPAPALRAQSSFKAAAPIVDRRNSLQGSQTSSQDGSSSIPRVPAVWNSRHSGRVPRQAVGTGELHDQFCLFATFGGGSGVSRNSMGSGGGSLVLGVVEMDGTHFAKLCRETGVTTKAFPTAAADLIFAKVKNQGKIDYTAFQKALALIAEAKGLTLAEVTESITSARGPLCTPGMPGLPPTTPIKA
ncbi:MAG: hypothetical protein WDW38_003045 [Sanguina aurantia]